MRASMIIGLASAAALAAGVAFAQDATDSSANANTSAAATASDSNTNGTAYESSSALGDAATLKAGDPGVVSNGPVPDTPQNRAKYGRPLSHAGRMTKPTGD